MAEMGLIQVPAHPETHFLPPSPLMMILQSHTPFWTSSVPRTCLLQRHFTCDVPFSWKDGSFSWICFYSRVFFWPSLLKKSPLCPQPSHSAPHSWSTSLLSSSLSQFSVLVLTGVFSINLTRMPTPWAHVSIPKTWHSAWNTIGTLLTSEWMNEWMKERGFQFRFI